MRTTLVLVFLLSLSGCHDPAEFRPARGAHDMPSVPTSYRVHEIDPACDALGIIRGARSIEDIAETAASHGATHYRVLRDAQRQELETESVGTVSPAFGGAIVRGSSTTTTSITHTYTAEAYRCN